jgi:hypothetical protein
MPDERRTADRAANRKPLTDILASMTEEAFSYFLAWTQTGYPDRIGGFQQASQQNIQALRQAGKDYRGA